VTGDKCNYKGKRLVSCEVSNLIDQHIESLQISDKITIMSWKDEAYPIHKKTMKKLLKKTRPSLLSRIIEPPNQRQEPVVPETENSTQSKADYVPNKGYLRFRASLRYGKVVTVMVCKPNNWYPDLTDLNSFAEKHGHTPKAILEYWGDDYENTPHPPVVIEKRPSLKSKLKSNKQGRAVKVTYL